MNNQKNNNNMSRQARNQTEKRKTPTWQFVVIGILLIILFYLVMKVFSLNQSDSPNEPPFSTDSVVQTTDTTESTTADTTASTETSESSSVADSSTAAEEEEEEETTLEETTPSDDLVIKAYTGEWEPVPTSQTEPHTTTNFSDGSADRKELKQAAAKATGVPETDMIEWWVGNNGPNKVVSTISDKKQEVIYRVYSEWVEGKGWKPTKIEELKENDRN